MAASVCAPGHGRPRPGSPRRRAERPAMAGRAGRSQGHRCASGRRARRIFPGAPSGLPRTDRRRKGQRPFASGPSTAPDRPGRRPRRNAGGRARTRRAACGRAARRTGSRAFLSRPTDTLTRSPRDAHRFRTCRRSPPRDPPHRPSHHARRDDASKVRKSSSEHHNLCDDCPHRDRNGNPPIGSASMIAKP